MGLTKAQLDVIRSGEPVRFLEEGTDLIVLRADVFERLQNASMDASPWTDEEMDLLAAEDADGLGWEGMEAYQGSDS